MQARQYNNFYEQKIQQKTDQQITIGVPVNIQNSNFNPYPNQHIGNNQQHHQHQSHQPYFQQNANNNVPPIVYNPIVQGAPNVIPLFIDYTKPINIRCPCCSAQVITTVTNQVGNATYIWAGLICFFVNPCCACIPFVTDKCMDKNHFCPNCGFLIMKKHKKLIEC